MIEVSAGRGRPRRYCSDRCRWKRGHNAARERWAVGRAASVDELLAALGCQDPHWRA